MLGISTHNPAQVAAAAQAPVDYVAVGPVFATASKENPSPIIGLEGVRAGRRLTRKPLVAIGGITPANASLVLEAGADSLAVISAIFGMRRDAEGGAAVDPLQSGKNAEDFLRLFR